MAEMKNETSSKDDSNREMIDASILLAAKGELHNKRKACTQKKQKGRKKQKSTDSVASGSEASRKSEKEEEDDFDLQQRRAYNRQKSQRSRQRVKDELVRLTEKANTQEALALELSRENEQLKDIVVQQLARMRFLESENARLTDDNQRLSRIATLSLQGSSNNGCSTNALPGKALESHILSGGIGPQATSSLPLGQTNLGALGRDRPAIQELLARAPSSITPAASRQGLTSGGVNPEASITELFLLQSKARIARTASPLGGGSNKLGGVNPPPALSSMMMRGPPHPMDHLGNSQRQQSMAPPAQQQQRRPSMVGTATAPMLASPTSMRRECSSSSCPTLGTKSTTSLQQPHQEETRRLMLLSGAAVSRASSNSMRNSIAAAGGGNMDASRSSI